MRFTQLGLKQKLQDRYKEHIYFSQLPGRENVIGFRHMTDLILSEMKKKEQQTKEDIIIAAAKLVKEDIREIEKTIDHYPTTDDITDDEKSNEWIPESLQTFLRILISSSVKKKDPGTMYHTGFSTKVNHVPFDVWTGRGVGKNLWF